MFEHYEVLLFARAGGKDETSRVLDLITRIQRYGWRSSEEEDGSIALSSSARYIHASAAPASGCYDMIYADEIQDCTQAEVALLLLAVGGDPTRLFLAGDTAQAVTHGVRFRFDEVREAVHRFGGSAKIMAKPLKLTRNFRSHAGGNTRQYLICDLCDLHTIHYALYTLHTLCTVYTTCTMLTSPLPPLPFLVIEISNQVLSLMDSHFPQSGQ
jgi:hypothetical protein